MDPLTSHVIHGVGPFLQPYVGWMDPLAGHVCDPYVGPY